MNYTGKYYIAVKGWGTDFDLIVRENEGEFNSPQDLCNHFNKIEMRSIRFDGDNWNASLFAVPIIEDKYGKRGMKWDCKGEKMNPDIVPIKRNWDSGADTGRSYSRLSLQ